MRKAKIVCTLGPASADRETVGALAAAGMAVARVNASHGTPEDRAALIERAQAVDAAVDGPVATMLDLRGPEVRTAAIDEPVTLATDSEVRFEPGQTATSEVVGVAVPLDGVSVGDRVLLDDGRIESTVTAVDDSAVVARVDAGGELGSRSGVNVPGAALDIEAVTDRDRADLGMAAEHGVDFVAASFVRSAADVLAVGEALEAHDASIPIVAKVERAEAVENLEGIVGAAEGVMVARGDLGVECPLEEVPLIQKRIVRRCQRAGVPVIIATEMLDSMIHGRRPSRAEASDVANAVLDGADAVMLSGETAVGEHPVGVVETMDRIVREVEASEEHAELAEQRVPPAGDSATGALARSARYLARDVGARAIVVASETGYTALKVAKFRPGVPIVAATPDDRVRRQLALSWGVTPVSADLAAGGAAAVIENAVGSAVDAGMVDSGDTVVVLSGMMTQLERSTTNTLKVHVATETLAAGRGVVPGRVAGPLARSADGDLEPVPDGAILYLPAAFDGELAGDPGRLAGIVHGRPGMTGYPAMVARELGLPMASGVDLPADVEAGRTVTLDGERGVVYAGDVAGRPP
ncbi:MAG: pyruvate kinase [Halobacteriales archaeon]